MTLVWNDDLWPQSNSLHWSASMHMRQHRVTAETYQDKESAFKLVCISTLNEIISQVTEKVILNHSNYLLNVIRYFATGSLSYCNILACPPIVMPSADVHMNSGQGVWKVQSLPKCDWLNRNQKVSCTKFLSLAYRLYIWIQFYILFYHSNIFMLDSLSLQPYCLIVMLFTSVLLSAHQSFINYFEFIYEWLIHLN